MIILTLTLLLLLRSDVSHTAPVATAPDYVSWESAPNRRGTWGILSSCTITLSLCVYTAVHLNLPYADASTWTKTLRRAAWTLNGIVAPEFVLYVAWKQLSYARRMCRDMKNLKRNDESSLLYDDWTLTHSFFACMGGFAMIPQPIDGRIWTKHPRLHLRPTLVKELAYLTNDLPKISKKEIQDRSKADSLSKALACLQASYIILQVIARVYARLPVTALEVNTIGHVLCALAIFIIWWQKPLNVEEPIYVDSPLLNNQALYLYQNEDPADEPKLSVHTLECYGSIRSALTTPDSQCDYWLGRYLSLFLPGIGEIRKVPSRAKVPLQDIPSPRNQAFFEKLDGEAIGCNDRGSFLKQLEKIALSKGADELFDDTDRVFILEDVPSTVKSAEINCKFEDNVDPGNWLAHSSYRERLWIFRGPAHALRECLATLPLMDVKRRIYITDMVTIERYCLDSRNRKAWRDKQWREAQLTNPADAKETLTPRLLDHTDRRAASRKKRLADPTAGTSQFSPMVFAVLACAYGGFHALLWKAHFPTTAERWAWRCSAIIIVCSGLFFLAASIAWMIKERFKGEKESNLNPRIERVTDHFFEFDIRQYIYQAKGTKSNVVGWLRLVVGLIYVAVTMFGTFVLWPCYFAARIFIIIEAFISLRSQPPAVYQTPNWPSWLPHL